MEQSEKTVVSWEDLDRRAIQQSYTAYFEWIRHLVTIALGTLTALISLKGQYIPSSPRYPWCLALALLALMLTVLLGLFALAEEFQGPIRAAKNRRQLRKIRGDRIAAAIVQSRPGIPTSRWHIIARKAAQAMMAAALANLCAFAIANIPGLW